MQARDDTAHPSLRRARPLGQLEIDRLEHGAGRDAYGARGVGELQARSALTDFFQGGECWSLNPYVGCLHDCAYCYVPDTMRAQRDRWGSYVLVKKNLPALLRQELRSREPRPVFLSSATDPYQPVEAEHQVTRRCLEVLARHDWPLHVLTRSPLVLRDLDLLRRFTDVEVGLSVPTLDDRARAALEPAAPPIPARLDTLRKLADAGVRTFANYSPAYPLTGGTTPGDVARVLKATGVQWVNTNVWIYLDGVLPVVRRRLAETGPSGPAGLDELPGRVEDPVLQDRLQAALRVAFAKEGLPLHAMMRAHRDDEVKPASAAAPGRIPGRPAAHGAPASAAPPVAAPG